MVTGGAGFIGSHLCEMLVERGCNVTCFDNFSLGIPDNVSHLTKAKNFSLVRGDIRDRGALVAAFVNADIVFHLAAKVGVKRYIEDPIDVLATNFYGTHNVLEACLSDGIQRIIFGSTSEVYGRNPRVPLSEDSDRVLGPATVDRWSYSVSKSAGEQLCNGFFKKHHLPVTILRYFNVYGPRSGTSDYAGVISVFIRKVLCGESPQVHGDGNQTRCFTYVRDAVEATIRAAEAEDAIGETINVGTSEETSISELARMVIRLVGKPDLQPVMIPHEEVYGKSYEDIQRRIPSTAKLLRVLRFKPSTSLLDGLTQTILWSTSEISKANELSTLV